MNKKIWKSSFLESFYTALTVAPTLAIVLLSAVFNVMAGSITAATFTGNMPVALSVMVLIALSCTTVLSVIYKKRFALLLLACIYVLAFCCYLPVVMAGDSGAAGGDLREMILLAFSLPLWSFMPLASAIGDGRILSLVISLLIAAVNLVCFFVFLRWKGGSHVGRKTEN